MGTTSHPTGPLMVGGTLLVYLLSRAFLEPRVPALLPPNIPSTVFLRREAFAPPEPLLNAVSGAGTAANVAEALPASLLVGSVGLAVVGVLRAALQQVTTGPLVLGPLFAFGIAQSELELLELGPFFWALAGGLIVSFLLEHDAWRSS